MYTYEELLKMSNEDIIKYIMEKIEPNNTINFIRNKSESLLNKS